MTESKDIHISALIQMFPPTPRDYPISPRENLLRALNHEKPLYMPNLYTSSQQVGPGGVAFLGVDFAAGFTEGAIFQNAWGNTFAYSAAQGSPTPVKNMLSEIGKWKEEVRFPDYRTLDILSSPPGFVRDENLAAQTEVESVGFEQLHMQMGFEQALIDLITEPKKCREFLEENVDYELEVIRRQHAVNHFDFFMYHDDWGTARAPFFSPEIFKEVILPPTARFVKEAKKLGPKFFFHNCGKIDSLIPYLVEEIGADAIQLQRINDIKGHMQKYGDRVTLEYQNPDPYLLYDPETTAEQILTYAREIVDEYGAQSNPGAGAIVSINAPNEDIYHLIDDEIYRYSLEKYRGL